MSNSGNAPARLHLDDGSRIIMDNTEDDCGDETKKNVGRDLLISVHDYFEIERISTEINMFFENNKNNSSISEGRVEDDEGCYRVALQFPDELLSDAMSVSWALEEHLGQINNKNNIMCFVLGDTTYGSCCPDEVGAAHLKAHLLVHYGSNACLSHTDSLPVLYSFGGTSTKTTTTTDPILSSAAEQVWNAFVQEELPNPESKKNLLLLYQLSHHSYILPRFYQQLLHHKKQYLEKHPNDDDDDNNNNSMNILLSSVPNHHHHFITKTTKNNSHPLEEQKLKEDDCNTCDDCGAGEKIITTTNDTIAASSSSTTTNNNKMTLGGLEIPSDTDLSNTILLYIGDDTIDASSRQFLNILLRCTSSYTDQVHAIWSWNPNNSTNTDTTNTPPPEQPLLLLNKDPMADRNIQKYLNRRFFVIQKARVASIYGILVGTLSQSRFRHVIAKVQSQVLKEGKTSYTLVVGKLNVAKLANFAEIECFVLVACPETSIYQEERDFPIPIITPAELDIALDQQTWGTIPWSTNFQDYLSHHDDDNNNIDENNSNNKSDDNDEDDDQPFFSLVTGTYVSKPQSQRKKDASSLEQQQQPGNGQMTEYKSEAAEYWKRREYQGLEANIGRNEVKAAVPGQVGIASNYKEDQS